MTDTPETDSWCGWGVGGLEVVPASCARKLERERDEARQQRDAFIKEIEIANERLRGKKHPDDNGIMVDGEIDIKQLLEQRDGLKSAADCASDFLYTAIAERDEARNLFKSSESARKSLNDACDSLQVEIRKLKEQRDRLTNALVIIAEGTRCQECGGEAQALFARESLTNQPK